MRYTVTETTTGTEVTMKQTLMKIAEIMDADINWVVDPERIRPSKSEVFRLCGDNTKIKTLSDWRPEWSLEEGLRATVDWVRNPDNLAKYKYNVYNR